MSDPCSRTTTRAESWHAWKAACAAERCPPAVRDELLAFGARRFRRYASRAPRGIRPEGPVPQGWHALETYAALHHTREGKRYKDWLFARAAGAADWVNAIEAGAALLLRSAVREWLRQEASPGFMTSLQAPVGTRHPRPATLEELLPDPADPLDAVESRLRSELAARQVAAIAPGLSERAKIVLWTRGHGWPLNHPEVCDWARTTPSVLYKTYETTVRGISQRIRRAFPGEEPAQWLDLAREILHGLYHEIHREFFPQNAPARFSLQKDPS